MGKKKCLVGIFMVLALTSQSVCFAAESIYDEYKDDTQYQLMLEEYGEEYAEEFLKDVLENRLQNSMSMRSGGGDVCYEYVTNIKQTKTYNCGSTTVLQTLYGIDSASQVSGSNNAAKIATLDSEYSVDSQGSMYVHQVQNALNKYSVHSPAYIYVEGSKLSESTFEAYIANSLTSGKPVILHAKTGSLSYYGGNNLGHYLSLDYVNRTTDIVRIVDCNYNDAYYGVHSVSLSEAYRTIHDTSGRYLIY